MKVVRAETFSLLGVCILSSGVVKIEGGGVLTPSLPRWQVPEAMK